jgi:hypothetical protein
MSETREAAYLEPLFDRWAKLNAEISAIEIQLGPLRKERTDLEIALRRLAPDWAAEHTNKPGPRTRREGGDHSSPSPERQQRVLDFLNEQFTGRTFAAKDVSDEIGLHITTIHKVLKVLHEDGRIQLDHLGGPKQTTRYFRTLSHE